MLRTVSFGAALLALAVCSVHASERRQLDSHVHGHGSLNIAVEGKIVEMEFEVPGADIVGFEHPATSAEDKAAIAAAIATLKKGDTLFVLSPSAGCDLEEAEARLVREDDHGHEKHGGHKDHDHGKKAADIDEESHTEFYAHYKFGCADPDKVTDIAFPYFATFPNAEELDIRMVTRRGASAYEVERDEPAVTLNIRR